MSGQGRDESRAAIISRARQIRCEIEQIFTDAAHWNRIHVTWKDKPIDPDPDCQLRRIGEGIDRMLAAEEQVGGSLVSPAEPNSSNQCDSADPAARLTD